MIFMVTHISKLWLHRATKLGFLCLPALFAWWLHTAPLPDRAPAPKESPETIAAMDPPHSHWMLLSEPERMVIQASYAMLDGQINRAEDLLGRIIEHEPYFRLAQALMGEIQRAYAGLDSNLIQHSDNTALRMLAEEWQNRLRALDYLPKEGSWPAGLVSFPPNIRHAFVLDANTLRLYWLQRADDDRPPTIISSFYVSVGKAGVGKEIEGDNKTPLGVYRIIGRRTSDKLPEFYGAGALILDYPNHVDRFLNRTGGGIWLHGSPPNAYTRDPLASEGCIVLANSDMRRLMELDDAGGSPVLVTTSLQWQSEEQHRQEKVKALTKIQAWARNELGQELPVSRLGMQYWFERDGHRYWRIEFHPEMPGTETHIWYLREIEDRLELVAGTKPVRNLTPKDKDHTNESIGVTRTTDPAGFVEFSDTKKARVLDAVLSWARAWSGQDIPTYLAHYHSQFKPEEGWTRSEWERQRRLRIESKHHIEVKVLQPQVRLNDTRATVTFVQLYRADGQRELRARKTLVLQREDSRWLIVQERVG